jgi:hypothetical protein
MTSKTQGQQRRQQQQQKNLAKSSQMSNITDNRRIERMLRMSSPQVSFFLFCYVWCTDVVHIMMYREKVCAGYFSSIAPYNKNGDGTCHEILLFLFQQYKQAIITTVGLVFAMSTVIAWQNNPLHQRMNLFIAQGLGSALLVLVALGGDLLVPGQRIRMFLSIMAVVASIFLGVRSVGIQTSRPLTKSSPINIWIFFLITTGAFTLLYFIIYGPNSYLALSEDAMVNHSEVTDGLFERQQRLLFYFTIAQYFTRFILLPLFAVFYLDTLQKKITLIFIALANIYHFISMSSSKNYIRHFDYNALALLTTAVLSINVAFLPEEIFSSFTTSAAIERRSKKKKN